MTERETYTTAEIALLPRKNGGANPPPANCAPIQLSTVYMKNVRAFVSITDLEKKSDKVKTSPP